MHDPISLFSAWLAEAETTEICDANACALATIESTADGPFPDVRIVLLKQHDADGFVFYSNFTSAKGVQMERHPVAALDFHWKSLKRQVRTRGKVHRVSTATADAYFATRPRESQISAWASLQSQRLETRAQFEAKLAEFDRRFPGEIPRPDYWGGWRLVPASIEFWEDRPGRQHHRERFTRAGQQWERTLLYP
ncbi:MAG: pyridoxamine 5'-phosphate oxidase [Sphingomonadaceae bacterium]